MTKRKAALLASCALALWVARAGHTTTLRPMSLAEMTDQAELIFTGSVVRSEVVLSRDGTFPFTFVTLRVEEVLKGEAECDELTLRLDGGQLGQEAVFVDGMPELEEGGSYLLFVSGNGRLASPIVGWRQGMLRFELEGSDLKLVDGHGRPVRGIANGSWLLGAPKSQPQDPDAPRAVLLSQEGVVITPIGDLSAGAQKKAGVVSAETAIDDLRSFIHNRSQEKSFVHPQPVRSVDPADVPDSMRFRAVAVRKSPHRAQ